MSKNVSNIVTQHIKTPYAFEYNVDLSTIKSRTKFIKQVEKYIRSSLEYRDYIQYLKDNIDMDRCAFFQKVTSNGSKKVRIEVHHEPFTLFDYVEIVLDKFEKEGVPINNLMIADEVMDLHYRNMVGLIPLSTTIHKAVHSSDKIPIPLNMVYGNYSDLLKEYEPYISDDLYDKLERKIEMTKSLTAESFDALVQQFTYIEAEGVDAVEHIETEAEALEKQEEPLAA